MASSINVLTIFPDLVSGIINSSILRRAQIAGKVGLLSTDLREFAVDKHRSVDDAPFGGQQGMLFKYPVVSAALEADLKAVGGDRKKLKVIYPSPRGYRLDQKVLDGLAAFVGQEEGSRITVICGRYEGIDERIVEQWVDLELSLGDFVLTGAEIPALAIVDGVVRLIPGVLGDERSSREDSFSQGLLEHPQYTKPRDIGGLEVPEELLSGHHKKIEEWKLRQSLLYTFAFRPDLIREHAGEGLPLWARELLQKLKSRIDLRA